MNITFIKSLCALLVTILGLTSCSENSGGEGLIANQRGAKSGMRGAGGQVDSDKNAKASIDLTKQFLMSMISNTSDATLEEFPEGFKKDNLIQIINDLSFTKDVKADEVQINEAQVNDKSAKDDKAVASEDVLFDHDFESKKLFYTQEFVDKYGQFKFTGTAEDELVRIREIAELILRELSQLMDIGKTKNQDSISGLFAKTFLEHMLSETKVCEGQNQSQFIYLVLNPQSGMSFYVNSESAILFTGESSPNLNIVAASNAGSWQLGEPFPFFELKSQLAQNAVQNSILKIQSENIVVTSSPYDLVSLLRANTISNRSSNSATNSPSNPSSNPPSNQSSNSPPDSSSEIESIETEVLFWNFENDQAQYPYRIPMNSKAGEATPSNSNVKGEETGLIQLLTDTSTSSGEAVLSTEVKINNDVDQEQTFNIPLECEQRTATYQLKAVMELNSRFENFNPSNKDAIDKFTETMNLERKKQLKNSVVTMPRDI